MKKQTKNCLLTGASGLVGRILIKALQDEGYTIHAPIRTSLPQEQIPAGIIPMPLRSRYDLLALKNLPKSLELVVHAAGRSSLDAREAEAALQEDAALLSAVLGIAQNHQARFILISSLRAKVGFSSAGLITDETPDAPACAYGRLKKALEDQVLARNPEAQILRLTPLLSPHAKGAKSAKGAMGLLARAAQWPIPLPVKGLQAKRSILTPQGLHAAWAHVLKTPTLTGACLVADDGAISIEELVTELRKQNPQRFPWQSALWPAPQFLRSLLPDSIAERLFLPLEVEASKLKASGFLYLPQ